MELGTRTSLTVASVPQRPSAPRNVLFVRLPAAVESDVRAWLGQSAQLPGVTGNPLAAQAAATASRSALSAFLAGLLVEAAGHARSVHALAVTLRERELAEGAAAGVPVAVLVPQACYRVVADAAKACGVDARQLAGRLVLRALGVVVAPSSTAPVIPSADVVALRNERHGWGARLREAREARGVSQDWVARRVGVKRSRVADAEVGRRGVPPGLVDRMLAVLADDAEEGREG